MRITVVAGCVVGRRLGVSTVRPHVELTVPRRARLTEQRMEGEALHSRFSATRLHTDFPSWIIDVDVLHDRLAIVADTVERAAHVVDEDATRARLIDQSHHPCGRSIDVRDRSEFDEVDLDHTFGRCDR